MSRVRRAGARLASAVRAHPVTVVALAVAVELRVIVLTGSLGALDADEAIVGLMARHVLTGDADTFYWGQRYGGTIEQTITAGAFAVAGATTLVLKLVPVLLAVAAAALVWRIGRRTIGERTAPLAAAIFLVWPATYVWWSTKSRGFYWACMVLGLVIVLCAVRIAQRPPGRSWAARRDWAVLGLAAGLGWWATPQIVFFAAPAGVWLLFTRWRAAGGVLWAVPTAALGAAPWIAWNLERSFLSLEADHPDGKGYLDHLHSIVTEGAPMMLGLKVPYAHSWLWEPWGAVAAVAGGVALAVAGVAGGRRTLLPFGALVLFPFLDAFLPSASVVAEGRYLLFALPFVALLLAAHARHHLVAVAVVVPLVALSVAGLDRMGGDQTYPYASNRTVPKSIDPLLRLLDEHDEDRLFADYWLAYRVMFETGEDVVATPTQRIFVRNRGFDRQVRTDPAPAWAFLAGTPADRQFGLDLATLGIEADRYESGGFALWVPLARVRPEDLPPHPESPGIVVGQ